MPKPITFSEVNKSAQTLIALTQNGDEIVLEENCRPLAKIIPFENAELMREFSDWETASDEDFLNLETNNYKFSLTKSS